MCPKCGGYRGKGRGSENVFFFLKKYYIKNLKQIKKISEGCGNEPQKHRSLELLLLLGGSHFQCPKWLGRQVFLKFFLDFYEFLKFYSVYEKAVEQIGYDFNSYIIWDAYLNFEIPRNVEKSHLLFLSVNKLPIGKLESYVNR